jgi:ABC-type nitrate/sulfonate/bicarbonate transport system substrate-binding protein
MAIIEQSQAGHHQDLSEIWFTRCPVPTATGIAADLGWFDDEFGPDNITVRSLQDGAQSPLSSQHFEHSLGALFREGGNVPALWTRSRGQQTRLIGLTWIEERQAILVRARSPLVAPADLKGKRLAIPDRDNGTVDFWRAMALHGFSGAMSITGLTLADAQLVDIPATGQAAPRAGGLRFQWEPELDALVNGEVDAVYVKGAVGVEAGEKAGARVLVDLDAQPDFRTRVNNGTPRPITVHQDLLDARPDIVARFLATLLKASDWAATHPEEVLAILEGETGAGKSGVKGAYRGDFHLSLHPDLSSARLRLLTQQKDFLLRHRFLESDVDIEAWADPSPLSEARRILAAHLDGARTEEVVNEVASRAPGVRSVF